VEIVVKGRHLSLDVGESFREHCADKLARLQRLDQRIMRFDVELSHEPNPRQSGQAQRVEITVRTRGPVVRAEAAADDCYRAFERAFDKLEERLRRAASRRTATHSHSHHAHVRSPAASANGTSRAVAQAASTDPSSAEPSSSAEPAGTDVPAQQSREREVGSGLVVREKEHAAPPMALEDALHAMELVGHDFYLFNDAETGQASVVYRRRGYDYGVLRLRLAGAAEEAS
jgi:ribosomal subunit interface protein